LTLAAPATWTVREGGKTVSLTFEGRVHIEKEDVAAYSAPARWLLIEERAEAGELLRKGDPLHVYSSDGRQAIIPRELLRVEAARKTFALQEQVLERDLRELREKERDLERKLGVARATLASLESVDDMRVELLRQEKISAERNWESLKSVLETQEELHRLGQVAGSAVDAARVAAESAELQMRSAEVEWQVATKQIDLAAVDLQRLEIRRLEEQLGSGEAGSGLRAEIEVTRRQLDIQRKNFLSSMEQSETEHHNAIRDSWDHTPVTWVEVLREGAPPTRISFQPDPGPATNGWQPDTGEAYDGQRGFGWDADRSGFMRSRGAGVTNTVAVVRGRAVWRCRTGPGEVLLRLGIGDAVDWRGAVARADGEAIFVRNRLKAGEHHEVTHTFTNTEDFLSIELGSPHVKTLMTEIDGIVMDAIWSPHRGDKVFWTGWPMTYTTPPEKYLVYAHVPREFVGVLTATATNAAGENGSARQAMITSLVTVTAPDGASLPGRIIEVGTTPTRLSFAKGKERDKIDKAENRTGRRVKVRLAPADAARLSLEASAPVTVSLGVPDGVPWVPSGYVAEHTGKPCVLLTRSNEPTRIKGFRLGSVFVVDAGLRAGDVLRLPGDIAEDTGTRELSFEGKIVPARSTPVSIPNMIWGEITDLLPEGSEVKKDGWIMSLEDPWLEKNKDQIAKQKRVMRQVLLEAAERRRAQAIRANLEHRERLLAEKEARVQVRALQEVDPLAEVKARNLYEAAALARAATLSIVRKLEETPLFSEAVVRKRRRTDGVAETAMTKAHLAWINAIRSADWLAQAAALAEWEAARKQLRIREMTLDLARQEEEVARARAKDEMERPPPGRHSMYADHFAKHRLIRAPVAGRVFYREGFNEFTKQREKIDKRFEVWRLMTVADVLDMRELALEAELPEHLYARAGDDMTADVVFDHLDGLTLPAELSEVGLSFHSPRDRESDEAGEQTLSSRKVFDATFVFRLPEHLQEVLIPGVKGRVVIQ